MTLIELLFHFRLMIRLRGENAREEAKKKKCLS